MKKIIIIKASGGELANQLWNYISVFAYAKENNLTLENWSFFEYGRYFNLPSNPYLIEKLFFLPFTQNTSRKSSFKNKFWRKIYSFLAKIIITVNKKKVLSIKDNELPFYLPPSENNPILNKYNTCNVIYLDGWIFRNPVGIEKYRKEIKEVFSPKNEVKLSVKNFLDPIKAKFAHVIGVHIRQGDYKTWKNGTYFITQKRIVEILKEYIAQRQLIKVCFVIASDGPIDEKEFEGLTIFPTKKTMIEDLFILSGTDVIIGSDSTFGDFASYIGDIPHIIAKNSTMDWQYYKDKNSFFENKYCTWVKY